MLDLGSTTNDNRADNVDDNYPILDHLSSYEHSEMPSTWCPPQNRIGHGKLCIHRSPNPLESIDHNLGQAVFCRWPDVTDLLGLDNVALAVDPSRGLIIRTVPPLYGSMRLNGHEFIPSTLETRTFHSSSKLS